MDLTLKKQNHVLNSEVVTRCIPPMAVAPSKRTGSVFFDVHQMLLMGVALVTRTGSMF